MTATIAAEMGEVAQGSTHYHALFGVGIILFLLTFMHQSGRRRAPSSRSGGEEGLR